jgi:hypothetical protein
MMEERYHATTQNRFYPDMSNVNKNITVKAKLISPPTYMVNISKFLVCLDLLRNAPHIQNLELYFIFCMISSHGMPLGISILLQLMSGFQFH